MQSKNDFNLHIEHLKVVHKFETYIETLSYFLERETDQEPEQVARCLNKKIIEEINVEANHRGLLKSNEVPVSIV
jgi:hypothetical protein